MDRTDIDSVEQTYGSIVSTFTKAGVAEVVPSTLELLGDALSEEDRRYIEDVYAPEIAKSDLSSLVLSEGGLALDFTAERLTGIITNPENEEVNLRGELLFELDAPAILSLLQELNGAPGLYRSTSATFQALAITVDGFSDAGDPFGADPVAAVRLLDAGDERFQERTIGLSASAEELGEERRYWRPHSW